MKVRIIEAVKLYEFKFIEIEFNHNIKIKFSELFDKLISPHVTNINKVSITTGLYTTTQLLPW